jgi:hypothetical protein
VGWEFQIREARRVRRRCILVKLILFV